MSDNLGSGALQSAPQTAADNVSTAPTAYDEIAATISKAISSVTGLVPAFERRHTETVSIRESVSIIFTRIDPKHDCGDRCQSRAQ
jgi:hypothetical protein